MESKGFIEARTALQPIVTKAEVAFVAAVFAVDEMAQATLNHPAAQDEEPNKGDANGQEEARETLTMTQVRGFQVKAMSFHVAEHLLYPHPHGIEADQFPLPGLVRNEVPGLLLTHFPVQ